MTKAEAVAFLRARSFHAFEREWAMGETIGVASEPDETDQGITVYARIVYIARQANGWVVEELGAMSSTRATTEPKSLEAACAEAVSLLSQPRRIV
jgi:hypothetical protein